MSSINERLEEIKRAMFEAHQWLNAAEALVKGFVADEKPTLEILARAFVAAEHPTKRVLRECGYCATWRSSPCGEGCYWSPRSPTVEQVTAQAIEARRAEPGTGSVHESAVGNADAPKPPSPSDPLS